MIFHAKHLLEGFLITMILLAAGCAKWDDLSWDTDISAPLLKTTINLNDLIPDSLMSGDGTNGASIDFAYNVFTLVQDTLFDFEQTITDMEFHIPTTLMLNPGQAFLSSVQETSFSFMDAEIRYMTVFQGRVKLTLLNPLKEKVVFNYSIPKSSRNGQPFSAKVTIPAAVGSTPGSVTWEEDISGYTLDLRGASGNKYNRIGVKIDAFIDSSANPVQITPFDTLKVNALFSQLTIREALGYFGQHLVSTGLKTTTLKLFDMVGSGAISLDSVQVMMQIRNGTGTDIRLNLKQITARNTKQQTEVIFTDPFIGVPMQIGRATRDPVTGNILPVDLELMFDPATTRTMFELFPDKLDWELDMEINPMGNISLGNDFMHREFPLTADLRIRIPLRLSANGLVLKQESSFYYASDAIHHGTLFLIADNRFPFDATLTVFLKDASGAIIDSLTPVGVVASGVLVPSDKIKSTRTILSVPCDPVRIANLKRTTSIALEVVLDTKPAGAYVQLMSDYDLQVVISANINTTLKP
jgi:hypothetical protein